ncbi:MAG: flagellar basal body-associated FliL family protein [Porticoccaceae bacterium]|nr:flagellar basal body-associated FliL family protein [Porticoccaceae bacterium]
MATDGKNTRSNLAKKGNSKRILAILIALTIVGGGGLYLLYGTSTQDASDSVKGAKKALKQPTIYLNLDPSFIVNFVYKDTLRYLQVNISVMARDQSVIDEVIHQMPAIRDRILTLLSNKTYAELSGPAHKEKLRLEMLLAIRKIVAISESGHSVDTVYFTGYVMQ